MRRFCFPWRREYSRLVGVIYRPVVEVLLHGEEGWIAIEAYVDSGADLTIFPRYIGEDLLGLEIERGTLIQPMGIARQPINAWIHDVLVRLGDESFIAKVAFADMDRIPSLIGRTGFFDRFTVVFDHKERETCFMV